MKKKTSGQRLAELLNISPSRGMEAVIKAQLIKGILDALKKEELTHQELAKRSGLPRSAVRELPINNLPAFDLIFLGHNGNLLS